MKVVILFIFLIPIALHAYSQDSTKTKDPLLSGYADVYYQYNLNQNATDAKTSFTHSHNSFELGMISLKVQHAIGKVSFLGDIGLGKRAEEFSYNDKKSSVAIKQLYVTYSPVQRLKVTIGSFNTYVGYELADANLNRNYSMSYMFSYGPFFHTGVKVDFTAGANTFMLGVFNPTDYKYAPPGSKKYIGMQWGYLPPESKFNSYLNYLGGEDTSRVRNDQLDLVMTYKISAQYSLAFDGTYSLYRKHATAAREWWGSALYINADFTKAFGLTLRTEYFNDDDQLKVFTDPLRFADGGHIWSFTLSGKYTINALTFIPEVRMDYASGTIFTKRDKGIRSSPTLLLAAVYSF